MRWSIQSIFDHEPARYLTQVNGDAVLDGSPSAQCIAKIKLTVVDIEQARTAGLFAQDLIAAHSTLKPLLGPLFTGNKKKVYQPPVLRTVPVVGALHNLLLIERIEVLPEYRAVGVTQNIIDEAIRLFACQLAIVVIQCGHSQIDFSMDGRQVLSEWQQSLQLNAFDLSGQLAVNRVKAHFAKMGFRMLPQSNVMVRKLEV